MFYRLTGWAWTGSVGPERVRHGPDLPHHYLGFAVPAATRAGTIRSLGRIFHSTYRANVRILRGPRARLAQRECHPLDRLVVRVAGLVSGFLPELAFPPVTGEREHASERGPADPGVVESAAHSMVSLSSRTRSAGSGGGQELYPPCAAHRAHPGRLQRPQEPTVNAALLGEERPMRAALPDRLPRASQRHRAALEAAPWSGHAPSSM